MVPGRHCHSLRYLPKPSHRLRLDIRELLSVYPRVIDFEARIISGGLIELVGPGVNNGSPVEEVHGSHEAVFEFLLG
jgi:hypothetical protein